MLFCLFLKNISPCVYSIWHGQKMVYTVADRIGSMAATRWKNSQISDLWYVSAVVSSCCVVKNGWIRHMIGLRACSSLEGGRKGVYENMFKSSKFHVNVVSGSEAKLVFIVVWQKEIVFWDHCESWFWSSLVTVLLYYSTKKANEENRVNGDLFDVYVGCVILFPCCSAWKIGVHFRQQMEAN